MRRRSAAVLPVVLACLAAAFDRPATLAAAPPPGDAASVGLKLGGIEQNRLFALGEKTLTAEIVITFDKADTVAITGSLKLTDRDTNKVLVQRALASNATVTSFSERAQLPAGEYLLEIAGTRSGVAFAESRVLFAGLKIGVFGSSNALGWGPDHGVKPNAKTLVASPMASHSITIDSATTKGTLVTRGGWIDLSREYTRDTGLFVGPLASEDYLSLRFGDLATRLAAAQRYYGRHHNIFIPLLNAVQDVWKAKTGKTIPVAIMPIGIGGLPLIPTWDPFAAQGPFADLKKMIANTGRVNAWVVWHGEAETNALQYAWLLEAFCAYFLPVSNTGVLSTPVFVNPLGHADSSDATAAQLLNWTLVRYVQSHLRHLHGHLFTTAAGTGSPTWDGIGHIGGAQFAFAGRHIGTMVAEVLMQRSGLATTTGYDLEPQLKATKWTDSKTLVLELTKPLDPSAADFKDCFSVLSLEKGIAFLDDTVSRAIIDPKDATRLVITFSRAQTDFPKDATLFYSRPHSPAPLVDATTLVAHPRRLTFGKNEDYVLPPLTLVVGLR